MNRKHYITLNAGIFNASLDPMENPPDKIDIFKPIPALEVLFGESTTLDIPKTAKWTFKLLRIDEGIPGMTIDVPTAVYQLSDESYDQ